MCLAHRHGSALPGAARGKTARREVAGARRSRGMDSMTVTLTFPADASSIRLARLVASGFASQLGATVADLDDLRTMVDELCSMLVAQCEPGDQITVRLESTGLVLHASATAPARAEW